MSMKPMNLASCRRCGGPVRAESLGWRCLACSGFIDMQGKYHEHIDRPFMPPMTFADKIRAMSDEELTDAIYKLLYAEDPGKWFCKGTKECEEIMNNDEDIPDEMWQCLLKKLQQPAEEV